MEDIKRYRPKSVKFRSAGSILRNLRNKLGRDLEVEDVKQLLDDLKNTSTYDWGEEIFPGVFTGSSSTTTQKSADRLYDRLGDIKKQLANEFLDWKTELQTEDKRKVLTTGIKDSANRIKKSDPERSALILAFLELPEVTIEDLDWFDPDAIKISSDSKESISPSSRTSIWSTDLTGKVKLKSGNSFTWNTSISSDAVRI